MNATAQRVLIAAERWRGTPFRHGAAVCGHGVDCGRFLLAVFAEAQLIPPDLDLGTYGRDWFLHRDGTQFLEGWLRRFCDPVPATAEPEPGDVAVFRIGRANGHAALVVAWPRVTHVDPASGVVTTDATSGDLAGRFAGAWRVRHGG